jgi:hypothetical protein
MEWDLGLRGLGLLLAMSIGFGVVVQLVMWRAAPHWLWIVAIVAYFLIGLFVSEVWFGWATEEDLQPNIDGLSFDEVMFLGTLGGVLAVLATWLVARRARANRPQR